MHFIASPEKVVWINGQQIACTIGRSGFSHTKREGDGATPYGVWYPRMVFYRSGRIARPKTTLPVYALRQKDGWCDAPLDRQYNQFVKHPFRASAEELWRQDSLYDLIVVINHNLEPIKPFEGSAVFIHLKHPDSQPTAGCIGLDKRVLYSVIQKMTLETPLYFGRDAKKSFATWF